MGSQMFFKEEIDKECLQYINKFVGWETFVFLKNYYLSARYGRMEIASLCFENYKDLHAGKYDRYFSHIEDRKWIDRKKEFIGEFLQVDLLSKTMMLIEDLSTISSALDNSIKKLPRYIFNKSSFNFINQLQKKRDESFLKIFGFPFLSELGIDLEVKEKEIYKKVMKAAANALRGEYARIKSYKDKHYHFYIGYKHSYSRIFAGHKLTTKPTDRGDELLRLIFLIDKNKTIDFHNGCHLVHNEMQFKAGIGLLNITFYLIDTIILNVFRKAQYRDQSAFPHLLIDKTVVSDDDLKRYGDIQRKVEKRLTKHDDFGIYIGYRDPVDVKELRLVEEKEAGCYTEFGKY